MDKNQNFSLKQSGSYQAQNAVLAIESCKQLSSMTNQKIQAGLDRWSWPGRMQLMKKDFFYDVAHNRNGIEVLVEDLQNIYQKKPIGVVVLKKDKINPDVVEIFKHSFDKLVISTIRSRDILNKKEIQNNPLLEKFDFIEVIPIYEFISCSKSKIINYLKSFLIPFKIKHLFYIQLYINISINQFNLFSNIY